VPDSVKKELAQALDAKNPIFHEEVDSSIIGGIRASTAEREIDLTIKSKLRTIITNVKESN
jgi:F0F1-type ATP synthase delta subunit